MIEYLKGKYNILRRIGKGGMAEIFLATTKDTEQKVAIKILHPQNKDSAINKKRFKSEIELTKKVDSPYVVKIIDSHWDSKLQYIVMEYIEGEILKNYVSRRTRLTVEEAHEFGKQLALGLEAIHAKGIVHRDVKASNVIIKDHGVLKIIDLGIAINDESERLTRTDSIIGSVHYLAPEIIDQVPANVQTDVYALGVLLFEMLTGDVPFKEKDLLQTAIKHKKSSVPWVNKMFRNIPQSLANVVAKATAKDPGKRYKSMREFFNDLDTCLNQNRLLEKPYVFSSKKPVNFVNTINSKAFYPVLFGVVFVFLLVSLITVGVYIF